MQNLNWDDLRYCLAVANHGSVSAAARELEVNHTTVSRRISALEAQLNARLFERSTSGWQTTPLADMVIRSAETIEDEVGNIRRQVHADSQELRGRISVTAVDLTIQRVLQPALLEFCETYPEISIDLIASENPFNLSNHEADIAFRVTNNPPPDVLGRKIADFAYGVYGTPEIYAKLQSDPTSVAAIAHVYGQQRQAPDWASIGFPNTPIRYWVNSINVALELARNGHGITTLTTGLGELDPQLVRIPSEYEEASMGFWLLSHVDLRTTARIRIFRDFMFKAIEPNIPLLEGRAKV